MSRFVPLDAPVDLRATLAPLARGPHDPCVQRGPREFWRATHTPDGPATQHLVARAGGVDVEAWRLQSWSSATAGCVSRARATRWS